MPERRMMNGFAQDLQYALRMMRLNPAFAAVAVLALALGIGANTAIFSVVNAVMLRPLPYPDAGLLFAIVRQYPGGITPAVSANNVIYWRENLKSFEAVSAFDVLGAGANLGGAEPERVKSVRVTPEFFRVFGVAPALGRGFTQAEAQPNGPRVAVISDGLWKRRFGAGRGILDSKIILNGEPWTVVGVMPIGFMLLPEADVLTPLGLRLSATDRANMYVMAGRLRPGVTQEQAQADSLRVLQQYRREYPQIADETRNLRMAPIPMQQLWFGNLRPAVLMLAGAVALVLLIACANLANLLLARAAARNREMAVRTALGAGRLRLVRQLLTESVLLSLIGGAAGLVLGRWAIRALMRISPAEFPATAQVTIDARVLLFTLAVAIATGVLFGLAPALQAGRFGIAESLKESGRGTSGGIRGSRLRAALVATEVALSLVLLVGAMLLIRSFFLRQQVQPGFDPRNVLTLQMSLSGAKYQTTAGVAEFARQIVRRIEALPGVEFAAMVTNLPMEQGPDLPFDVEGRRERVDGRDTGGAQYRVITPNFFRAMSIPLRNGRFFEERDSGTSEPVVIINEALARAYFRGVNPIGERITIGRIMGPPFTDPPRQIVGIAGDVCEFALDRRAPPTVYVPSTQVPDALTALAGRILPSSWVVRTRVPPLGLAQAVRREVLAIDAQQPISNVRPLEQVVSRSMAGHRFNTVLLAVFSALALVLSIVGIYGVMSYTVTQRTHEIGIRMALGATRGDAVGLVVKHALIVTAIGTGIGLACSFGLTRLISGMLYGVSHADPPSFALVTLVLTLSALAASYIPARRASRVDPANSLRYE
ncbi:MAG TPA: ABC transporter permease [Bryobacteraceae bacterium]|nr:ABC transporter permease [Bryobacteraceae bacterium]